MICVALKDIVFSSHGDLQNISLPLNCDLCKAEDLTERVHDDPVCWAAPCFTHREKLIVVLKRHTTEPTREELNHIRAVARDLRPRSGWRGPVSIPEHFHLHEI